MFWFPMSLAWSTLLVLPCTDHIICLVVPNSLHSSVASVLEMEVFPWYYPLYYAIGSTHCSFNNGLAFLQPFYHIVPSLNFSKTTSIRIFPIQPNLHLQYWCPMAFDGVSLSFFPRLLKTSSSYDANSTIGERKKAYKLYSTANLRYKLGILWTTCLCTNWNPLIFLLNDAVFLLIPDHS